MPRWTRTAAAAILCCTLSACVYYNTFYNAEKLFKQAHERRHEAEADPDNRSLERTYLDYYLTAIKKASTVLDLHPDSKWVDDSLLLIGKAYYWRGEHGEALLKFDELLNNFPQSELRTEALYWKALALWGREDFGGSRELLTRLSESAGGTYASQARLALAELEQSQGNLDRAIRTYLTLVGDVKDEELQSRLWKGLGDTYFDQRSYEDALNAYRKTLQTDPDDRTAYQTRLRIGTIHERMANLDEAIRTYERMADTKRFRVYEPQIRLRMANVHRLEGDIERALAEYEEVSRRYPRTETSAEAIYQIARIEHEVRRNNEKALELFGEARKERSGSDAAGRAREMENTLYQLSRYRERAADEDEDGIEALFNLAEIYLLSLGQVDSALSAYAQVPARSDSTATPKALYGMGVIYADSLDKADEADRLFSRLVAEYPVTPYAVAARRRLGGSRSDDVLAEARYLEAEALKAEGADATDVVTILRQVTKEYPNSLYAPKALFALAWTYENDLNDFATATDYYGQLVSRYPLTDFADISEDKIDALEKELRDRERESERRETAPKGPAEAADEPVTSAEGPETTGVSDDRRTARAATGGAEAAPPPPSTDAASQDPPARPERTEDGPLESSQVDRLPTLVYAPPPPQAEVLAEEDVSPTVSLRMLIDREGTVRRVVVTEGSELLREQASRVAYQYRFEPGVHNGKPREVWMEFPITFIRPAQTGGEPP